jgi:hypothetical protein
MIKNVYWSYVKCQLFLSDFNETWIFPMFSKKKLKYQISWKSVQWESSSSMRTDMTQLRGAFRNFANASKNLFLNKHRYTICVCVCVCVPVPNNVLTKCRVVIKFCQMQCDQKMSLYRSIKFTIINNTNTEYLQILMWK